MGKPDGHQHTTGEQTVITGNNKTDETRGDTGGQADKVKQEIIEKKCKFDTEKNTDRETKMQTRLTKYKGRQGEHIETRLIQTGHERELNKLN